MAEKGSSRGPKIKTLANSRRGESRLDASPLQPTSKMSFGARREFKRLVQAITARGLVGKVDPGHLTLLAKFTAELDRLMENPIGPENARQITSVASQVRGLRRECQLTLSASRPSGRGTSGNGSGGGLDGLRSLLRDGA
jgi:hypothetical protein